MQSRRDFIKKVCISGGCVCGFGGIIQNHIFSNTLQSVENKKDETMPLKWIKEVLINLDENLNENQLKKITKSASIAHHKDMNMENMLLPYKGKLDEFVKFIEEKWDWKVTYEDNGKILIADENKHVCVCPLLKDDKETKYPALCYCSEGFAERMFSYVCEQPVVAIVTSSIQRGDKRCIYRINL
jgi:hypothetical protein